jgi:hypothetical protein
MRIERTQLISNLYNPTAISNYPLYFAIKIAISGSVGGLLFGYDLGVISGRTLIYKNEIHKFVYLWLKFKVLCLY